MKKWFVCAAALLLATHPCPATDFLVLNDECDDGQMIDAVSENKDVVQFRTKLEEFRKKLHRFPERDFIALFGTSQKMDGKAFAMPVAEYRMLTLSGIRYGDVKMNKNHTEFYSIKDTGAIEVYYGIDGERPSAFVFYFPTDKEFP